MNTQDLITIIGWGSPIGLGVFFAGGTAALYLLAKTAKLNLNKKD
jgi:hypothetical protein